MKTLRDLLCKVYTYIRAPHYWVLLAMFVNLVPAASHAQVTWGQAMLCQSPSKRVYPAMAYDATRARVLLFGGYMFTRLNDTWEWDGFDWVQKTPATSPQARLKHSMVFDSARGVAVLFGGLGSVSSLQDTWEWDGVNWSQKNPATRPPARNAAAMAFDAARGRTVLFGGFNNGQSLSDTWEWDGTNWQLRSPVDKPSGRSGHVMAYDEAGQRVILFGGFDTDRQNDTWAWNGTNWTLLQTGQSPLTRNYGGLVYDNTHGRILLFGGLHTSTWYLNDLWELQGNTWNEIVPSQSPSARSSHGVAYDRLLNEMVTFGGSTGAAELELMGDTYIYSDRSPPIPCPTVIPTPSATPTPQESPTPTPLGTPTPSPTPTPGETPTPTESPTPSETPTPSPSLTPSPTPTPSESPTPTPSNEPTPSPTTTPGETPTPSPGGSTPTPTPSESTPTPTPGGGSTPTPTPTNGALGNGQPGGSSVPTPTPTTSVLSGPVIQTTGGVVRGRVVLNGKGVAGVFVSAGIYGSTVTDANGNFSFENIPPGVQQELTLSRTGLDFSKTTVTIGADNVTEILVEAVPDGVDRTLCATNDISLTKLTVDSKVLEMKNLIVRYLGAINGKAKALRQVKNTRLSDAIEFSARNLLLSIGILPEVFFSCEAAPNCFPIEIGRAVSQTQSGIKDLSAKLIRAINRGAPANRKAVRQYRKYIRREIKALKASIAQVPVQTFSCR